MRSILTKKGLCSYNFFVDGQVKSKRRYNDGICHYSDVIIKAKDIIEKSPNTFEITGAYQSSLGEGDVFQSAIYVAKFILSIVNRYFSNTSSEDRYKLIKIVKGVNPFSSEEVACRGVWSFDSDSDEAYNDYCEQEYHEMMEIHNTVIITAYIEKYTSQSCISL